MGKGKVKAKLIKAGARDEIDKALNLFGRKVVYNKEKAETKQAIQKESSIYEGENEHNIVPTPFDMHALAVVPEKSEIVAGNITAMEQNVAGFGWLINAIDEELSAEEKMKGAVKKQADAIKEVLTDPNTRHENFVSIGKRIIRDRETFGHGFMEVVRNRKGDIASVYFCPAKNIRKRRDKVVNGKREPQGFVQLSGGDPIMFYRDFGDDRIMDRKTGEYKEVPYERQASELIMVKIHNTHSTYYGVPRYIPAELAITGNHYAAKSNNNRFKNNNVPDYAMIISNGEIIDGEDDIQNYLKENFNRTDGAGRFLVMQVEGEDAGYDPTKPLQRAGIQIVEMNKWKDARWKKYEEANDKKIRRIWRLSPIITGDVENVNRASANAAKEIAEEQVFNPERVEFDELINQTIVQDIIKSKTNSEDVKVRFQWKKMHISYPDLDLKKADRAASTRAGSLNEIRAFIGLPEYEDDDVADTPIYILEREDKLRAIEELKQAKSNQANENANKVIDTVLTPTETKALDILSESIRRKYSQ